MRCMFDIISWHTSVTAEAGVKENTLSGLIRCMVL